MIEGSFGNVCTAITVIFAAQVNVLRAKLVEWRNLNNAIFVVTGTSQGPVLMLTEQDTSKGWYR